MEFDVESHFGHAFERFFEDVEDQVELLREAMPAVVGRFTSWSDVANVAPTLGIPDSKVGEFVEVWEEAFGSRDFAAILSPLTVSAEVSIADDEPGHDTATQPEADAEYPETVVAFIYDHGRFLDLQRAIRKYWRTAAHAVTIAKSALVFSVGALEAAVADVERARLNLHNGAAGDKRFSLDDLLRLGDMDAVIYEAIEERVEGLCYGNLESWNEWFLKAFKVSLEDQAADWPNLREVVQRRHIIAHNGGRVSRLYLERAGVDPSMEVGSLLPMSPSYVYKALDDVCVVGIRLMVVAWRKLGNSAEHMESHLSFRCYDSLVSERWVVADCLAKELCKSADTGSTQYLIARVNGWLARKGIGEDVSSEVEMWDVQPLSARYRLAKAALIGDVAQVKALVPTVMAAGEVGYHQLLSWPLFREVRSDPAFAEVLARAREEDPDRPK